MPVEIIGLPECPNAGDRFDVCKDEKSAEEIANVRKAEIAKANEAKPVSLEDLFSKIKASDVKELPVILKCDVAGSVEAVKGLFDKVSTNEVKLKLIHTGIGAINESDVLLASTTKGMVVGFNVRPDTGAQAAAKARAVEIKTYSIVYELVDDMKKALGGLLAPIIREKVLGRVQVRNVFTVPKIGTIAGCFVTDGMVTRNSMLRLLRDGKVVYQGKVSSLKRFKDDAREVQTGFECGIGIENFNDIKVGDEIEAYTQESVVREL
jgi:translation initiation factor IF-2